MTFLKLLADIRHDIDKIFVSQEYENVNFSVDVSKSGFGEISISSDAIGSKTELRAPI